MSPKEAFKAGFLLGCADKGLTPEETQALVKQAIGGVGTVIGELIEAPGRFISSVAPHVLGAGLLAGVGIPAAVGGVGGWALAKATDDDSNIEAAKQDELLAEYQRLTDQAKRQAAVKQLRGQPTLGLKRPLVGAAA